MEKEEKVQYWIDIANEDLAVAEDMHKTKHWLYVAFMCHQAIEKVIKAFWCGTRDDDPPYLHDHWRLLEGCGLIDKLSDTQKDFIELMAPMYIAARYPEHKQRIALALNESTCYNIVEQTKQFKQWILQEYSASTKPSNSSDATSN